ncbi:FxLYD domain-containing protein [Sulfurimonas sp.]|uniref:FxLYD domain-containing protein n=1 Tax=Sulfurimonas sp. TaxID=2022749 RepID=UPI003D122CD6
MNFIKIFLQKFGNGLFIGLIAGITAGFIFAFVSMKMSQSFWVSAETIEKLTISEDREVERNGRTVILGNIKNNSNEMVRMYKLKVDLFDANETFIEQCTEFMSTLHSGKQTNFKVCCKNSDNNKTIQHTSYKIYATEY